MKTKLFFSALLILLLVFIGFSSGEVLAQDNITIAGFYPLTGPSAPTGEDCVSGLETGIEIVNNSYDIDLPFARTEGIPNLDNRLLELILGDHEGIPEQAATEADRLSRRADVFVGAFQSSAAASVALVAERTQTPLVVGDSSSPTLSDHGYRFFFRVTPHDGQYVKTKFDFLKGLRENYGHEIETMVILHENSLWGQDVAEIMEEVALEEDYNLLARISYDSDTADMSSEISRIEDMDPDVVMHSAYISDAVLSVRTFEEFGYRPNIIANSAGHTDPSYIPQLGESANYTITRSTDVADLAEEDPVLSEVLKIHRELHGTGFSDMSIRNLQTVFVIADALNRAQSTNNEDIRAALSNTDIPSEDLILPWEGLAFDEHGDNIYATGTILQVMDQEYKLVYPFEEAIEEVVWPVPSWDEQ